MGLTLDARMTSNNNQVYSDPHSPNNIRDEFNVIPVYACLLVYPNTS